MGKKDVRSAYNWFFRGHHQEKIYPKLVCVRENLRGFSHELGELQKKRKVIVSNH